MKLDVDATRVHDIWIKHAAPNLPPLPSRTDPPDNRWQRGSVVDAIYLADDESTVRAEWYRHLAESGIPPVQGMPRELCRWRVDVVVADLSTEERLARVGLPSQGPADKPGRPFKQLANSSGATAGAASSPRAQPDPRGRHSVSSGRAEQTSTALSRSRRRGESSSRPCLRPG